MQRGPRIIWVYGLYRAYRVYTDYLRSALLLIILLESVYYHYKLESGLLDHWLLFTHLLPLLQYHFPLHQTLFLLFSISLAMCLSLTAISCVIIFLLNISSSYCKINLLPIHATLLSSLSRFLILQFSLSLSLTQSLFHSFTLTSSCRLPLRCPSPKTHLS